VPHEEALLKTAPPERRTDVKLADRKVDVARIEQIEGLGDQISWEQEKYQEPESF
jgi:hypothetical protein